MQRTTTFDDHSAGAPNIERALKVVGTLLGDVGPVMEPVVIGGAALNILGFVSRPTRDVDVLGLRSTESGIRVVKANPLPAELAEAAARAAADLGLENGWLNSGPTDLLDWGLPEGFASRLTARRFGARLVIYLPDRIDLISLKVYAAADTGVGRHTDDLRALGATCPELLDGVRWARPHDPSPDFRGMLTALLRYFGCTNSADEIEDERTAP